jgi:hypothetical protein
MTLKELMSESIKRTEETIQARTSLLKDAINANDDYFIKVWEKKLITDNLYYYALLEHFEQL